MANATFRRKLIRVKARGGRGYVVGILSTMARVFSFSLATGAGGTVGSSRATANDVAVRLFVPNIVVAGGSGGRTVTMYCTRK